MVCTDFDLGPSVKLLSLLHCEVERGLLLQGPAINACISYLPKKRLLWSSAAISNKVALSTVWKRLFGHCQELFKICTMTAHFNCLGLVTGDVVGFYISFYTQGFRHICGPKCCRSKTEISVFVGKLITSRMYSGPSDLHFLFKCLHKTFPQHYFLYHTKQVHLRIS